MSSRACQVLASLHLRQREPSLGRHEVTFSAFASQNSSKHGKTKGTRHSPDMLTLRLSKNIAEQVTSGPMVGHHVTPWWPDVRVRKRESRHVVTCGQGRDRNRAIRDNEEATDIGKSRCHGDMYSSLRRRRRGCSRGIIPLLENLIC